MTGLRHPEQGQHVQQPDRLREDTEIGPLLERGNREFSLGLDEAAAFQRLAERIELASGRKRWHRAGMGAALAFAAAIAVAVGVFREQPDDGVAFGPELMAPKARGVEDGAPNVEVAPPGDRDVAPDARPTEPARLAKPRELSAARLLEAPADTKAPRPLDDLEAGHLPREAPTETTLAKPKPENAPRSARPPSASPRGTGHTANTKPPLSSQATPGRGELETSARVNCLDIAGRDARAAESCFAQRATGSGLGAEMALYEMARLRRDMLRDALGALSALNDYRQRFPRGSLRHEVDISRIELLSQLGRSREALSESEALLFSSSGRERAAELHVLRGNVFRQDLADWAAAALEYSLAEPFGGTLGAEASRLRGQSLEAMGDVPGAIAAYRRYVQSAAPSPRRSEVARRVEQLGARTKTSR
jgi:hypothetical protein